LSQELQTGRDFRPKPDIDFGPYKQARNSLKVKVAILNAY